MTRRAACALLFSVAAFTAMPSGAGQLSACGDSPSPEEVLRRINEIRARGRTCGATGPFAAGAPLRWSERLAAAAQRQSIEMARLHRMSHRDSRDRGLGERLSEQGYAYAAAAENVAFGYRSVDDVMQAWLESQGHCENLMSDAAVESGLACADAGDAGAHGENRYWTLVFGAPAPGR
jgi:uncharacterized protein YkwD